MGVSSCAGYTAAARIAPQLMAPPPRRKAGLAVAEVRSRSDAGTSATPENRDHRMSPCLSDGGRTSSAAEFPANREKNWEIRSFWPIFGKTVAKSPTIQGGSRKIPYAREQGIFSAEQGIKVPCSAENREIPAPDTPPVRRFPR